jgi:hypothetical protein
MDFDKNIDQLCNPLFPVYTRDRVSGLQLSIINESEYVDPWDLDDFKDHAKIDFATDDNLLAMYLKAATIDVEKYLQKSLGVRTFNLLALYLPKNYRLPFGPVEEIFTTGYTLFGDILKEGGKEVDIEYSTNASLVNDSIIQAIYKQAFNYYENRDSNGPVNLDNVVKKILDPYRVITLL